MKKLLGISLGFLVSLAYTHPAYAETFGYGRGGGNSGPRRQAMVQFQSSSVGGADLAALRKARQNNPKVMAAWEAVKTARQSKDPNQMQAAQQQLLSEMQNDQAITAAFKQLQTDRRTAMQEARAQFQQTQGSPASSTPQVSSSEQ